LAQCSAGFQTKAAFSDTLISRVAHPFALLAKGWDSKLFPLLADAELPNDRLVALGIVSLEVVEQATPLADQHEQAAARAVVLLVRLEVVRQLANAFTDDGDLNLGTPRVSRVRLILVNYGFLLLSG
jgi:hypothetical protein